MEGRIVSNANPYTAPKAQVEDVEHDSTIDVERVASGQKLVIYSILASFVVMGGAKAFGAAVPFLQLGVSVLAIIGIVRLAGGLGRSTAARVIYAICMFVPLINIVVMVMLSMQGTKALRNEGYDVGLFGAKDL